jgi:hypothetical protein
VTRTQALASAKQMSQAKANTDDFVAAAILIASSEVGPSIKRIAKFLGIPRGRFAWMAANLRRNGVWRREYVYCEWLDENSGGAAFLMDSCVALGLLVRVKEEP